MGLDEVIVRGTVLAECSALLRLFLFLRESAETSVFSTEESDRSGSKRPHGD